MVTISKTHYHVVTEQHYVVGVEGAFIEEEGWQNGSAGEGMQAKQPEFDP